MGILHYPFLLQLVLTLLNYHMSSIFEDNFYPDLDTSSIIQIDVSVIIQFKPKYQLKQNGALNRNHEDIQNLIIVHLSSYSQRILSLSDDFKNIQSDFYQSCRNFPGNAIISDLQNCCPLSFLEIFLKFSLTTVSDKHWSQILIF